MHLTEEQISSFRENGYLVVEDLLGPEDLQPVIDEYSQFIDDRANRLKEEGKLDSLHEGEPFHRRLMFLAEQAPEIAGGLDIMEVRGESTFRFLMNPKILDVAESLCSSEIVCNPIQHIRAILPQKEEGSRPTPWHQDAGVAWPDADPYFMLTVWVAIVDATLENGCLEIIPKSHELGLLEHAYSPRGLDVVPEAHPPIEPLPVPIKAGGVILFNNYNMHRARRNLSDTVRWSFDLRYHDAYQPSGRPHYPSFLFRSKLRAEKLQTDYSTWADRWEFALKSTRGTQNYRWPKPDDS